MLISLQSLKSNLEELNDLISKHQSTNNSKIEELTSYYLEDRLSLEKERESLLIEIKNLKSKIEHLKTQNENFHFQKKKNLENLKKEINHKIEDRLKQK